MSKHIDDLGIDDTTVCLIQDSCHLKWPESFTTLEPAYMYDKHVDRCIRKRDRKVNKKKKKKSLNIYHWIDEIYSV